MSEQQINMATPAFSRMKVARYYDETQVLYTHIWNPHGVHYGVWTDSTSNLQEAIRNLDEIVASQLALPPGSRVLDAGCGIGGTSHHFQQRYGFQMVGITLSKYQLGKAKLANQKAADAPRFVIADYLNTGFEAASFDGVFAIESVCYAEHKKDFLIEARRLLRPGGSLVVSDGFLVPDQVPAPFRRDYQRFLKGLALDSLGGFDAFRKDLVECGFQELDVLPLNDKIMRSAWYIELLSWIGLAVCAVGCTLRLMPKGWFDHGLAGISQRRLFANNIIQYAIFTARRSSTQP